MSLLFNKKRVYEDIRTLKTAIEEKVKNKCILDIRLLEQALMDMKKRGTVQYKNNFTAIKWRK